MKRNMKSVLITGSGKGLGANLALVFAKNGYDIILHGRDEKGLATVKKAVLSNGVECEIVMGDITSNLAFNTIDKLYETAEEKNLDVLINNAGAHVSKPFQDMDIEELETILNVNLIAPIQLIKRIYPIFAFKKSGLIININSVAGKIASELEAAYCASKYGLRGFAESLQFEANKDGVQIINVYPGAMQTAMNEHREDYRQLIKTDEAAEAIFRTCKDYKSLKITEINIQRRVY